jgi:AcrR family transcriptional regulator
MSSHLDVAASPRGPPRGRGFRVPLSKERVLCAAVQLADEAGVASLPMRKLAETLGVEAMSLYHYITDKDEILDGMVDLVFGEIELPSLEADWKATMRQRAISARDAPSSATRGRSACWSRAPTRGLRWRGVFHRVRRPRTISR